MSKKKERKMLGMGNKVKLMELGVEL